MVTKWNHKLIMIFVIIALISGVWSETPGNSATQPAVQPAIMPVPTDRATLQPTVRAIFQPAPTKRAQTELIKLAVLISTNAVEIPTFGTLKWYKDGLPALIEKEVTATFPDSKYSLTPSKILADILAGTI